MRNAPGGEAVPRATTPSARVNVRVLIDLAEQGLVVGELALEREHPADHRRAAVDDLDGAGSLNATMALLSMDMSSPRGAASATEPSAGSIARGERRGGGGLGGLLRPLRVRRGDRVRHLRLGVGGGLALGARRHGDGAAERARGRAGRAARRGAEMALVAERANMARVACVGGGGGGACGRVSRSGCARRAFLRGGGCSRANNSRNDRLTRPHEKPATWPHGRCRATATGSRGGDFKPSSRG